MYSQLLIRFPDLFLFTAERREKQLTGWLQASLFELRADKPPEKLKKYLVSWGRVIANITSASSAISAVRLLYVTDLPGTIN